MEATEAAGELLASPGFSKLATSLVAGDQRAHERRIFEFLIRTISLPGAPGGAEVIAHRVSDIDIRREKTPSDATGSSRP